MAAWRYAALPFWLASVRIGTPSKCNLFGAVGAVSLSITGYGTHHDGNDLLESIWHIMTVWMPFHWLVRHLQLPCRTARHPVLTSSAVPPPLIVRPSYGDPRSFDVRFSLSAVTSTAPTGPAFLAIHPSGRSRFYRSTGIIANLSIV